MAASDLAPELQCTRWFNSAAPLTLAALRGKVVVIEAFQILCPGCVMHALPQMQRLRHVFPEDEVAVLGLHTVFEHHAAMADVALEAFLHEYRIGFPVGVDTPSADGPIPRTMAAYGMRGTPTLLLIDRQGRLREHHFGQIEDIALGAEVAVLMGDVEDSAASVGQACRVDGGCDSR